MLDFDVQRCTRLCAATQREFEPGEAFYSVLLPRGAEIVREDYCQEAWPGPSEEAVGYWRSTMPCPAVGKMRWAPNDVILDYFQRLEGVDQQSDTRYVLGLLLIRRRIVRLEETLQDEQGETMVLYVPRNETEHRVAVVPPNQQRREQIQEELAQMLFGDST